jgi:hypothetical protein
MPTLMNIPVLLFKVTKNDRSMTYDNALWTNDDLLNPKSSPDKDENAKYAQFLDVPIQRFRVCIGGPSHNCAVHELEQEFKSAKHLFSSGFVRDDNLDQDGIADAYGVDFPHWDKHCSGNGQKPGFNLDCDSASCHAPRKARWGFCCQEGSTSAKAHGFGLSHHNHAESVWFYAMQMKGDALVMKLSKNGQKDVLDYDSPYWENTDTLNPSSPHDTDESAKYPEFMTTGFQIVKFCFHAPQGDPAAKCVLHELAKPYSSAKELFTSGFVSDAKLDKKGLMKTFGHTDATIGKYFNADGTPTRSRVMKKPGFNTKCPEVYYRNIQYNKARWGFCVEVSSSQRDTDAAIGIGLHGQTVSSGSGAQGGLNSGSTLHFKNWHAGEHRSSVWLYVVPTPSR